MGWAKQETMSLVTKVHVAELRSRESICYWTTTMAITWATSKSHCGKFSFCWPLVHVIWIQTFSVSLQATFQMYQISEFQGGSGLFKVCIDNFYQVKTIEVAETRSEEVAITDTYPA